MKKIITLIAILLTNMVVFAQAPQKISFQAVVRDASNSLITNQLIGMRISVLQGSSTGTSVYVETQTPTTNINGLASLEIGTGNVVSGAFASIDWSTGNYYIKTETDPTGGTSYTVNGTSQLLSVPYALYAGNAGGGLGSGSAVGNTPYWNGATWETTSNALYNNGSQIGVGTTTPAAKLDIAGNIKIADGSQGAGKVLTSDATGLATWAAPTPTAAYYHLFNIYGIPSASFELGVSGTMVSFTIYNNCSVGRIFGGSMLINPTGEVTIINYAPILSGTTMTATGNVITLESGCGSITITLNVTGTSCTMTTGGVTGAYTEAKLTVIGL